MALATSPSPAPRRSAISCSRRSKLGTYLQDQIKLGGFTLVLSGRNDWVATTPGRSSDRRDAAQPRRQQVQRPRRPDLQFRQRPRALRRLRDQLQSDHRPQRVEPAVPAGNRRAGRDRLEVPAGRLRRPFQRRRVRPEAAERADDRSRASRTPAEPDRRGHLARPRTRGRGQSRAWAEDGRRVHHLRSLHQQGPKSGADRHDADQHTAADWPRSGPTTPSRTGR